MTFLVVPYSLAIIGIPVAMVIPFYFFNKYLQKKINPRESGKKLLWYLGVFIISLFAYISIIVLLIIELAKLLK
jgi:hypothetical protein